MIVLELACAREHRFEGWFASADAFAAQGLAKQVACPVCGSTDVKRVPSAAHLAIGTTKPSAARMSSATKSPVPPLTALRALIDQMKAGSEDVGDRFAEEARRIHYEAAPERAIRGQATVAECRELQDEGIAVLALPDLPPERLN